MALTFEKKTVYVSLVSGLYDNPIESVEHRTCAARTNSRCVQKLPQKSQDGAKIRSGVRKIDTIAPKLVLEGVLGASGRVFNRFCGPT